MLKAKPVASLRRKSFGGQSGIGIYWRKRSVPTSVPAEVEDDSDREKQRKDLSDVSSPGSTDDDNASCNVDASKSSKKQKVVSEAVTPPALLHCTADESPALGWDDDLCRPIYHHDRVSTGNEIDNDLIRAVSSGDGEIAKATEIDDASSDEEVTGSLNAVNACSDEDNNGIGIDSIASDDTRKSRKVTAKDSDDSSASFQVSVLSRKRTRTFGNRRQRQRPLSLMLIQEEEAIPITLNQDPRRVSLESSTESASMKEEKVCDAGAETVGNGQQSCSQAKENRAETKESKKRKQRKLQSDAKLEKAREYFKNLDNTQTLTLDDALSPPVSSRVTRTHRRINLSSPGINREYQSYVEAIVGDGDSDILPLSIRDYASSRKLHYESKGEIVDGFLDD